LHDESEIFREERGVEHAYLYLYTPFSASEKGEEMREVLWRELGFN
jgi:hypothetical protein